MCQMLSAITGGAVMICSICGRRLKSAKSRELGYGPVCYKRTFGSVKLRGHKENSSAEEMPYYDIPGQITIEEYLKSLEK